MASTESKREPPRRDRPFVEDDTTLVPLDRSAGRSMPSRLGSGPGAVPATSGAVDLHDAGPGDAAGALRLGIVVALFGAYAIAYFLLFDRHVSTVLARFFNIGVCALGIWVIVRPGAKRPREQKLFRPAAVLAFALLASTSAVSLIDNPTLPSLLSWGPMYLAFLFVWICGWGYLVVVAWTRAPPRIAIMLIFAALALGFTVVYLQVYPELFGASASDPAVASADLQVRFKQVLVVLELVAILVTLARMVLGGTSQWTLMIFGITVLAGSNFGYLGASINPIDPKVATLIWSFGLCLLFAGTWTIVSARGPVAPADTLDVDATRGTGSELSVILLLISLGTVMISYTLDQGLENLADAHREWRRFVFLVFVVVLAVFLVWLTRRFDDSIEFLEQYVVRLHRNRMVADDWRDAAGRLRTVLSWSGLGTYLDFLRRFARRVRRDVIFLGPERLFGSLPPRYPSESVQCFLVMPFSATHSEALHACVKNACHAHGIHLVRGDDSLVPKDIVDHIWVCLNEADFVIADISGHNPNVYYELGIAHTLAKPVLLLTSQPDDIPFDVSTRGAIAYSSVDEVGWEQALEQRLRQALEELLELYGFPEAGE